MTRLARTLFILTTALSSPAAAATLNFFYPDDISGRRGYLALTNSGNASAQITISGRDDLGQSGGTVTATVGAHQSVYLSSTDLERGKAGTLNGTLGNGSGYWHLNITASGSTVTAQNFLLTSDGAISELSGSLAAEGDGSHLVKFFREPGTALFTSKLRLRNLSATAGTVTITAKNAAGAAVDGSVTVSLPAYRALVISDQDLLNGNAALGVTGSLGRGDGHWTLTIDPDVSIAAAAVAESANGQLADVGTGLPLGSNCPSANFLAVAQHARNTRYTAPTLNVTCDSSTMTVVANGIPNFEFVQTTPSALQAVPATYKIPLTPTVAGTKESVPLVGAIGVSVGGLPFFGPTESPQDGSRDPVVDELLDYCNGHTAQYGWYHHHARPTCLFPDAGGTAGLVVGYAFDGYPILHPYECTDASCSATYKVKSSYRAKNNGATAAWDANEYVEGAGNLDRCNGMTRPDGSYAYYATDEFPYFLGCYNGVVTDRTNFDQRPTGSTTGTGGTTGGGRTGGTTGGNTGGNTGATTGGTTGGGQTGGTIPGGTTGGNAGGNTGAPTGGQTGGGQTGGGQTGGGQTGGGQTGGAVPGGQAGGQTGGQVGGQAGGPPSGNMGGQGQSAGQTSGMIGGIMNTVRNMM